MLVFFFTRGGVIIPVKNYHLHVAYVFLSPLFQTEKLVGTIMEQLDLSPLREKVSSSPSCSWIFRLMLGSSVLVLL